MAKVRALKDENGVHGEIPSTDTLDAKINVSGPNKILWRTTSGEGAHEEGTIGGLTAETTPAAGDYLLAEVGGELRKIDISDLPSGGGAVVGEIKLLSAEILPDNTLLCDGSAVSRTTYADLFALVGTSFGAGDGSTTFNLPDMRDRFPVGASGTKAIASTGGAETVTLSSGNLPAHTHTVNTPVSTVTFVNDEPDSTKILGGGLVYTSYLNEDEYLRAFNTGSEGSGTAVNIVPKYTALRYVIYYAATSGGGGVSFNEVQRTAFLTC